MADIVDKGVVGGDTPYIWKIGGFMLLVALGGAACSVGASFLSAKAAGGFGKDLRKRIFGHVEQLLHEFDTRHCLPITRTTMILRRFSRCLL